MKIAIVGAGPAGLLAASLIRQSFSRARVTVYEQNSAQSTFGFGVVFSDRALDFLQRDDPDLLALIAPAMRHWSDITVVHGGQRVVIDGVGFSAIARLELLRLLRRRAQAVGATLRYNVHLQQPPQADLVIAADGVNSQVRNRAKAAFGVQTTHCQNRYAWYGVAREYDTLTQTFLDTPDGPMNAHHYSYAPGQSTFIIEMADSSWRAGRFDQLSQSQQIQRLDAYFADHLQGASLQPNRTQWRQFPLLKCAKWYQGNCVLVGDALHSAHFSIGSGTRLAMEDVIALVAALRETRGEINSALAVYQAARQPVLEKILAAANRSAAWYDNFGQHMALSPWPFALSYIQRAGRLSAQRLATMAPQFSKQLLQRGIVPAD